MKLTTQQKRDAINFARNFAAGIVESSEMVWQTDRGMSEDQLEEAQREMSRIAKRISNTLRK